MSNVISELLQVSMNHIKDMIDANTIIGTPIHQEGITIIMVSHDIGAAVRYADHILHIGQEPHFFGTTEEYLKTPVGSAYAQQGGMEA